MRTTITIDFALDYLNRLVKADPRAMRGLLEDLRVPCNDALANDLDCQVSRGGDGNPVVGLLGILSGMFGTNPPEAGDRAGWGTICAVYDVCCPATEYYADTVLSREQAFRDPSIGDCDVTLGEIGNRSVGQPCPKCGKPLVLGQLLGFQRTWDSSDVPAGEVT